jgi:hypothetical protein
MAVPVSPMARASTRVPANQALADGDTWIEKLAVVEGTGNTLHIRSYFRNIRTRQRVWDEPPSGASHIVHATATMHRDAQEKLQELQTTLSMIPLDPEDEEGNGPGLDSNTGSPAAAVAESTSKGSVRKVGLFRRFRLGSGGNDKSALAKRNGLTTKDDAKDLNLQKAIARSLADNALEADNRAFVYYDPEEHATPYQSDQLSDEDAMAMAIALSLSNSFDQESKVNEHERSLESEEALLERAIEESRQLANAEIAALSASLAMSSSFRQTSSAVTRLDQVHESGLDASSAGNAASDALSRNGTIEPSAESFQTPKNHSSRRRVFGGSVRHHEKRQETLQEDAGVV